MATKGLTPQEVAEKHNRRTKGALQDMIKGVSNVTVNPAAQAITKKAKLVANWQEAMNSGKWERGMKRVTLESWQAAMSNKGAQRVAAGLDGAMEKTTAFFSELLPFQADLSKKIETLPDLTIEDSIQRASTWIRGMSNFRKAK
jgi:hypothetical protein